MRLEIDYSIREKGRTRVTVGSTGVLRVACAASYNLAGSAGTHWNAATPPSSTIRMAALMGTIISLYTKFTPLQLFLYQLQQLFTQGNFLCRTREAWRRTRYSRTIWREGR